MNNNVLKNVEQSPRGRLNRTDLIKISKSCILAGISGIILHLGSELKLYDYGEYTPLVAGGIMIITNVIRKFLAGGKR